MLSEVKQGDNFHLGNCIEYSQKEYERCVVNIFSCTMALLKILYLMKRWIELEILVGWQWPVSFLSTYCIFLVDTSERWMSDNIAMLYIVAYWLIIH